MSTFMERLRIFGIGAVIGGSVAFVFVSQHRQSRLDERDAGRALLSDTARAMDPAMADAILGLKGFYASGRGALQHRMVEYAYTEPAATPGHVRRVLILQGQDDNQRLRVVEELKLPVRSSQLPMDAETLAQCRVLDWQVTAPDRVVITLKSEPTRAAEHDLEAEMEVDAKRDQNAAHDDRNAAHGLEKKRDMDALASYLATHRMQLVKRLDADHLLVALPYHAASAVDKAIETLNTDPSEQITQVGPYILDEKAKDVP